MVQDKIDLHVLCTGSATRAKWAAIQGNYPDLRVNCVTTESAIDVVRAISGGASRPFLICRDDVWIGRGLGAHVKILVTELDRRFPNWALCGNRGVAWDGQLVFDYTHETNAGGLQTSVCAHTVISLADDLLLVNPAIMNAHRETAPAIEGRVGLLLSLECLRNGSVLAVSPHLMILRSEPEDDEVNAIDSDSRFREYYREFFLNHHLATPDGMIDLSRIVNYGYISDPRRGTSQADVLNLYDRCLKPCLDIRRPSLTICCRTQFRRPAMLDRAVLSFAAFRQHAEGLADVVVRLISDASPDATAKPVETLARAHPGAALECWHHEIRVPRFSRTDLLLAAIERAETDYIWFVDDDDFANPAAAPALARCLTPGAPILIVTSAAVIQESWTEGGMPDEAGPRELLGYRRSDRFHAAHLYRVLRGRNFIPNCGMVFPLQMMKQRAAKVEALGDYNEDFFLLLLALTASRVEVRLLDYELSSVSMRGSENTVGAEDRSDWHFSLATFLLEILNQTEDTNPFLWQLGNAPRW